MLIGCGLLRGELGWAPQAGMGHLYSQPVYEQGQLLFGGKRKLHTHWPGLILVLSPPPRVIHGTEYSPSIGFPATGLKCGCLYAATTARHPNIQVEADRSLQNTFVVT